VRWENTIIHIELHVKNRNQSDEADRTSQGVRKRPLEHPIAGDGTFWDL
jgi:hypothetical protein